MDGRRIKSQGLGASLIQRLFILPSRDRSRPRFPRPPGPRLMRCRSPNSGSRPFSHRPPRRIPWGAASRRGSSETSGPICAAVFWRTASLALGRWALVPSSHVDATGGTRRTVRMHPTSRRVRVGPRSHPPHPPTAPKCEPVYRRHRPGSRARPVGASGVSNPRRINRQ